MSNSSVVMTENVERVHTELWRAVRKAGVGVPPLEVTEEKGKLHCVQPVVLGNAFILSFLCRVNARHMAYEAEVLLMEIMPVLRLPGAHLMTLSYRIGAWTFRADRSGVFKEWNRLYERLPIKAGPITDMQAVDCAKFLSRYAAEVHSAA